MDETIAAIKKDTLTIIDDRDPEKDSKEVQLSNFSVFENRETGEIELYLTRYGERADWRTTTNGATTSVKAISRARPRSSSSGASEKIPSTPAPFMAVIWSRHSSFQRMMPSLACLTRGTHSCVNGAVRFSRCRLRLRGSS